MIPFNRSFFPSSRASMRFTAAAKMPFEPFMTLRTLSNCFFHALVSSSDPRGTVGAFTNAAPVRVSRSRFASISSAGTCAGKASCAARSRAFRPISSYASRKASTSSASACAVSKQEASACGFSRSSCSCRRHSDSPSTSRSIEIMICLFQRAYGGFSTIFSRKSKGSGIPISAL